MILFIKAAGIDYADRYRRLLARRTDGSPEAMAREDANLADQRKRPLYVNRRVANAADIIEWAKRQGFKTTLPAEDIHATVAYSKAPVDWHVAGKDADSVTAAGGTRKVAPLGDKGAVVLHFESPDLSRRWAEFKDAGASWDYDGYHPHLTITYDPGDVDLDGVEPYDGPIEFGPERFEALDDDWPEKVKEVGLAKAQPTPAQAEAGNYKKKHIRFQGLDIAIENPKGSVRSGKDRGGHEWSIKMRADYGYINGSMGVDGDQVDCYIGPHEAADTAFIVTTMAPPDFARRDENKCMLGYASEAEARSAFLAHYDNQKFFGEILAMPMEEFKDKVLATKDAPKLIKGEAMLDGKVVLFMKAHVKAHTRVVNGKVVQVGSYSNKVVGRPKGGGADSHTLFLFGAPEKPTLGPSPFTEDHMRNPEKYTGDLFDADAHGEYQPARPAYRVPKEVEVTDLTGMGEVNITSIGNENVYFEKDGKAYFSKVWTGNDRFSLGPHDFSASLSPSERGESFSIPSFGIGSANTVVGQDGKSRPMTKEELRDHSDAIKKRAADPAHAEGDKWVMPIKDAIAEHNDLVHAAETPGKSDDKKEMLEQKGELKRMQAADAGDQDHPAPIPRRTIAGLSDEDRAKWIEHHRQQHELTYYEMPQVRKKMEAVRHKKNEAESEMRQQEHHEKELRESGLPGSIDRADLHQNAAHRMHQERLKHAEELSRLSSAHQVLYAMASKHGRAKHAILPESDDLRLDFMSGKRRSDREEEKYAADAIKQYRSHYKGKTLRKSILFLRQEARSA